MISAQTRSRLSRGKTAFRIVRQCTLAWINAGQESLSVSDHAKREKNADFDQESDAGDRGGKEHIT